uniref:CoA transferase n=1 Tax=Sphingomonas bacterium TaxID=1895847 RepID=UPI001C2D5AC0
GGCRLFRTRDGWMALNLPRDEDWELIPALLGEPAGDWEAILRLAATRERNALLAQARLLGLAAAADETPAAGPAFTMARLGSAPSRHAVPLVVDMSSLWAGPLAGALLAAVGARVVKVESRRRPDGARLGDKTFYDLLNAGKASVALDLTVPEDRRRLGRLIDTADIVIESARPRALLQMGIDAADAARRGATWIAITAHGRAGEAGDWIGYGDDAGVAAGVSAAMARAWGAPLFAGDAIADPLTGITAAVAGWASWRNGGGHLISLALSQVAAHAARLHEASDVRAWQTLAASDDRPLYPLRVPPGAARSLGADSATVLETPG